MATIASVTPTVCSLMGIKHDKTKENIHLESVINNAKQIGIDSVKKVLIYAPDALGVHLHKRFKSSFEKVKSIASIGVEVQSVSPSITPVCFATMFTGVPPKIHGIRKYEKPVIKTITLFDRAISAGKKVAIVAIAGSSIDIIFRERKIDYFSEEYDPQVTNRTVELIKANEHDLILTYHQEYDDMLHQTEPFSSEAIQAMNNHISSFEILSDAFNRFWRQHDRLIVFAPDHGAHLDTKTGKGNHGLDIPEDMELIHYYGVYSGNA